MNFLDAKKIVSPDSPVVPGSKEHKDILKLMRQSGRVFAEDNVPAVPIHITRPIIGIERAYVGIERKVSKKEFQSISANVSKGVFRKVETVFPSVAPTPGMSKKQWLQKTLLLNISDGSGEEVQAIGEIEGRTGENQGGS